MVFDARKKRKGISLHFQKYKKITWSTEILFDSNQSLTAVSTILADSP